MPDANVVNTKTISKHKLLGPKDENDLLFQGQGVAVGECSLFMWTKNPPSFEGNELQLTRFVLTDSSILKLSIGTSYLFCARPHSKQKMQWKVTRVQKIKEGKRRQLTVGGLMMVKVRPLEDYPGVYRVVDNNAALCDHFGFLDDPSLLLKFHCAFGCDFIEVGIIDTLPSNLNPRSPFRFRITEVPDDPNGKLTLQILLKLGMLTILRQSAVVVSDKVIICKRYPGFAINLSEEARRMVRVGQHIIFNAYWNINKECFVTNFVYVLDKQPLRWVRKPIVMEVNKVFTAFWVSAKLSEKFAGFLETEEFGLVENRLGIKFDHRIVEDDDGSSAMNVWVMNGLKSEETGLRMARTRFEVVSVGDDEPVAYHDMNENLLARSEAYPYPQCDLNRPGIFACRPHRSINEQFPLPCHSSLLLPRHRPSFFGYFQRQRDTRRLHDCQELSLDRMELQRLNDYVQRLRERIDCRRFTAATAVSATSHNSASHNYSQLASRTLHEEGNTGTIEAGRKYEKCCELHVLGEAMGFMHARESGEQAPTEVGAARSLSQNSIDRATQSERAEQCRLRENIRFFARPKPRALLSHSQQQHTLFPTLQSWFFVRECDDQTNTTTIEREVPNSRLSEHDIHSLASAHSAASLLHSSSSFNRSADSLSNLPLLAHSTPRKADRQSSIQDKSNDPNHHSNRFGSGVRKEKLRMGTTTLTTKLKKKQKQSAVAAGNSQPQISSFSASRPATPSFSCGQSKRPFSPSHSLRSARLVSPSHSNSSTRCSFPIMNIMPETDHVVQLSSSTDSSRLTDRFALSDESTDLCRKNMNYSMESSNEDDGIQNRTWNF